MSDRVHLVRHGEVSNPRGIVYADLPGFGLSGHGWQEARATASYLATRPVVAVYASPLLRAVQTASVIAEAAGVDVEIDDRLTEFLLSRRWRGLAWADLAEAFPGELEAYLADPTGLAFSPESLAEMGARVAEVLYEADVAHHDGEVAIVGHQDPIQAARLIATGRPFEDFHEDKPRHGSVITLVPGEPWVEVSRWLPGDGLPPWGR